MDDNLPIQSTGRQLRRARFLAAAPFLVIAVLVVTPILFAIGYHILIQARVETLLVELSGIGKPPTPDYELSCNPSRTSVSDNPVEVLPVHAATWCDAVLLVNAGLRARYETQLAGYERFQSSSQITNIRRPLEELHVASLPAPLDTYFQDVLVSDDFALNAYEAVIRGDPTWVLETISPTAEALLFSLIYLITAIGLRASALSIIASVKRQVNCGLRMLFFRPFGPENSRRASKFLTPTLGRFGRVIVIGDEHLHFPSTALSPHEMDENVLSDWDEVRWLSSRSWQSEVRRLLGHADLIVADVSTSSPNIAWEVGAARERFPRDQIVIIAANDAPSRAAQIVDYEYEATPRGMRLLHDFFAARIGSLSCGRAGNGGYGLLRIWAQSALDGLRATRFDYVISAALISVSLVARCIYPPLSVFISGMGIATLGWSLAKHLGWKLR